MEPTDDFQILLPIMKMILNRYIDKVNARVKREPNKYYQQRWNKFKMKYAEAMLNKSLNFPTRNGPQTYDPMPEVHRRLLDVCSELVRSRYHSMGYNYDRESIKKFFRKMKEKNTFERFTGFEKIIVGWLKRRIHIEQQNEYKRFRCAWVKSKLSSLRETCDEKTSQENIRKWLEKLYDKQNRRKFAMHIEIFQESCCSQQNEVWFQNYVYKLKRHPHV